MFFFKLLILYFLIYGILFLSGWGICEKTCIAKNAKYKFLLAPIIGMIPLSAIPMYLSFLGVKSLISGWITFIVLASISIYYLIKSPPHLKKEWNSFFLFLIIIIGICPSFAVIMKAGYLTSNLQSYSTFVIYLAEYFTNSSANEAVHLDFNKPFTNMLFEIAQITPFVGHLFFIATISSIFNVLPYKLYLVLSGIAGSFIPISV